MTRIMLRSCRCVTAATAAAARLAPSLPGRRAAAGLAAFASRGSAARPPLLAAALDRRASFSSQADAREEQAPGAEAAAGRADPEAQILQNALRHVTTLGWTVEALAAGARDAGFPSVAHGMFPRGAAELVEFFMDACASELRAKLSASADLLQAMAPTERVKWAVRARLELLAPVLATWPQAMALGALPPNAPGTVQRLATLADDVWFFAGDQSSGAAWYAKRAALTAVYASTELFLLSDRSPGFQDTWAFLDRRVDETIALGELPRNMGDVAGMASIGLQSVFSAVTSLAGPIGAQVVANSPLAHVPNPLTAISGAVPAGVASTLAAGFPAGPTPADLELKDLRDIDAELEKLGGADEPKPSA